ncbi:hypothetical protein LguiB_032432 [Lonicera macranthoides]
MTGDLSTSVYQMTNLRHLHLADNFFGNVIPPEYGRSKQPRANSIEQTTSVQGDQGI